MIARLLKNAEGHLSLSKLGTAMVSMSIALLQIEELRDLAVWFKILGALGGGIAAAGFRDAMTKRS